MKLLRLLMVVGLLVVLIMAGFSLTNILVESNSTMFNQDITEQIEELGYNDLHLEFSNEISSYKGSA